MFLKKKFNAAALSLTRVWLDAGSDISKVLCETTIESHISLDAMLRDSDSRGALLLVFPAYVHSLLQVPLNVVLNCSKSTNHKTKYLRLVPSKLISMCCVVIGSAERIAVQRRRGWVALQTQIQIWY